jgi:hypothetical protein
MAVRSRRRTSAFGRYLPVDRCALIHRLLEQIVSFNFSKCSNRSKPSRKIFIEIRGGYRLSEVPQVKSDAQPSVR